MISEYTKQQVLQRADVVDVVGDAVQLRRVGSRLQCCCPFHGERTPSFYVNPASNRWHCFGCGADGDAIEFVMRHNNLSFPDALIHLANRYGIEVKYEKRERTQQEAEQAKHRESLLAAIAAAQSFFTEQLQADTPEAAVARQYAYGRWGEEFCKENGIGYAPKGNPFVEWCKRRALSDALLKEVGLVCDGDNGRYAMFRERVTIPIRDRWGKPIAFTARYIGDRPNIAKYINSITSAIFKKDETLFGFNNALRKAGATNCFILVEGAPDVLRLQSVGLTQAVAPLGTALTEKHLETLRRVCRTMRFIPDSDPPKDNSLYPAGTAAVIKSGAMAMRCGFDVYVREIPRTAEDDANGVKKDPDSYIASDKDYFDLPDRHFVVWLAEKRFAGADTSDLKRDVMAEVGELLTLIEDKLLRDMCIDELSRIYGKPKQWKEAMQDAGRKNREIVRKDLSEEQRREVEQLARHNLVVRHHMYYTPGKDGDLVRLSNFVMEPCLHVKGENSSRTFRIINEFGEESELQLSEKTLCSLKDFNIMLGEEGNYIFHGKPDHLQRLKEYWYANFTTAFVTEGLGWQPHKFFAYADGIFADGRFIPVGKGGEVRHGNRSYFLPAYASEDPQKKKLYSYLRKFRYTSGNDMTLKEYAAELAAVFGDGGKVGFAWLLACLWRDYIQELEQFFPILNYFGVTRSGKSSIAVALVSFFYTMKNFPKLSTSTKAVMSRMLANIHNAPLVLDEYTNMLDKAIVELLKGAYDGKVAAKMELTANGLQPTEVDVFSGLILLGQHKPTADDALFNRCLYIPYSKTVFTPEEEARFERFRDRNAKGNSHLAMEVLKHYDHVKANFSPMYDTVRAEMRTRMGDTPLHGGTRMIKNWAIPLTVYRLLEGLLDLPFSYKDMFDTFMRCFLVHNADAKQSSETAEFWKYLESLVVNGKVVKGTHFCIKHVSSFTPLGKSAETTEFGRSHALLYLNLPAVMAVLAQRSGLNQMKMDQKALEYYLKTSAHYLGRKQCRFVLLLSNGQQDVSYTTVDGKSVPQYNSVRSDAYVFDYETLKASTEIELDSFKSSLLFDNDAEEEPATPAAPPQPAPQAPTLFTNSDEELPF